MGHPSRDVHSGRSKELQTVCTKLSRLVTFQQPCRFWELYDSKPEYAEAIWVLKEGHETMGTVGFKAAFAPINELVLQDVACISWTKKSSLKCVQGCKAQVEQIAQRLTRLMKVDVLSCSAT